MGVMDQGSIYIINEAIVTQYCLIINAMVVGLIHTRANYEEESGE